MNTTATTSFPIFTVAFIVLLILKLTETIAVSWFVVFIPVMIGVALTVAWFIVALIILAIFN